MKHLREAAEYRTLMEVGSRVSTSQRLCAKFVIRRQGLLDNSAVQIPSAFNFS